MLCRLVLVPLLALALAVSIASPALADMTQREAKDTYLAAICPTNVAHERLHWALFRGQDHFFAKDLQGKRLQRVRARLLEVERAEFRGARKLLNPPDAWPTNRSHRAVERVADAMLDMSHVAARLRSVKGQRFVKVWNNRFLPTGNRVARLSREARAELGLPSNGHGC